MHRGGHRRIELKRTVAVGETTVERTVAGRYEWRDRGVAPLWGVRKRLWHREREREERRMAAVAEAAAAGDTEE